MCANSQEFDKLQQEINILNPTSVLNSDCTKTDDTFKSPTDKLADTVLSNITNKLLKIQRNITIQQEIENVIKSILVSHLINDQICTESSRQNKKEGENNIIDSKYGIDIKEKPTDSQNFLTTEEQTIDTIGKKRLNEDDVEESNIEEISMRSFLINIKKPDIVIQVAKENRNSDSESEESEEEWSEETTESDETESESEESETRSEETETESDESEYKSKDTYESEESSEGTSTVEETQSFLYEPDYFKEKKYSTEYQKQFDIKDKMLSESKEDETIPSVSPFITGKRLTIPDLDLTKQTEEEENKETTMALACSYGLLPAIYYSNNQIQNEIEDEEFQKTVAEKLKSESPKLVESVFVDEREIFKYQSTPAILKMGSSTERSESDISESFDKISKMAIFESKDDDFEQVIAEPLKMQNVLDERKDLITELIWNLPRTENLTILSYLVPPYVTYHKTMHNIQKFNLSETNDIKIDDDVEIVEDDVEIVEDDGEIVEDDVEIDKDDGEIIEDDGEIDKDDVEIVEDDGEIVEDDVEIDKESSIPAYNTNTSNIEMMVTTDEMPFPVTETSSIPSVVTSSFHVPIHESTKLPEEVLKISVEHTDTNFQVPTKLHKSQEATIDGITISLRKPVKKVEEFKKKEEKVLLKDISDIKDGVIYMKQNQLICKRGRFKIDKSLPENVTSKYISHRTSDKEFFKYHQKTIQNYREVCDLEESLSKCLLKESYKKLRQVSSRDEKSNKSTEYEASLIKILKFNKESLKH
ncbi:myb-like protein X [Centruroides vittatus]|uniref:myb-like protein X n=1 Tax=Centruroides vittatus TaxID=120091 RepID=UPI00350F15F2